MVPLRGKDLLAAHRDWHTNMITLIQRNFFINNELFKTTDFTDYTDYLEYGLCEIFLYNYGFNGLNGLFKSTDCANYLKPQISQITRIVKQKKEDQGGEPGNLEARKSWKAGR